MLPFTQCPFSTVLLVEPLAESFFTTRMGGSLSYS